MRIWSISARAYGAIPIPLHQASKASELSMDKLLENRRPPRCDTRQPGRRLAPTETGQGSPYSHGTGGSSFLSALTYRTPASLINSCNKRPFSIALRTSGTSL